VKFGKSASETLDLLTLAYGEYPTKKSNALEWHRQFKEGQEYNQRRWQQRTQKKDLNVN
jgi:hypothetical protein